MLSVIAPGSMQKPMVPRASRIIKQTQALVHTTMQTVRTEEAALCAVYHSPTLFFRLSP
jgi:hypothetical protein